MTNKLIRIQNVICEYRDGVKHIMRADGYEGLIIDGVDVLEGKKAKSVCYDYRPSCDCLYSYQTDNGKSFHTVFAEGIEMIDETWRVMDIEKCKPLKLMVNGVDIIECKNFYACLHSNCQHNHYFEFQDKDGKTYPVTLPREFKIEEIQPTIIE